MEYHSVTSRLPGPAVTSVAPCPRAKASVAPCTRAETSVAPCPRAKASVAPCPRAEASVAPPYTRDEPSEGSLTSPWTHSLLASHRASSDAGSEISDELLSASLRGDVSSTAMMADASIGDLRAHTLPADLALQCSIFDSDSIPRSSRWTNFKKMFYLGAAHNMHSMRSAKLGTKASKYSQCRPTTTESATQTAEGVTDLEGLDLEGGAPLTRHTRKTLSWDRVKGGLGLHRKTHTVGEGEEGEKRKISGWMDSVAHSWFPRLNQEAASSSRQWARADGKNKVFSATLPREGRSSCEEASGCDNKGFTATTQPSD